MAEKKYNIFSYPNDKFYFCSSCRKRINSLDEILLVEGHQPRGFCSENCIHNFFDSLVQFFDSFEQKRRGQLNIENEQCLNYRENEEFFNQCVLDPTEVYCSKNEFGEEIFFYLKKIEHDSGAPFYFIIVCLVYEHSPSFIILNTCTEDEKFIEDFKIGKTVGQQDLDDEVDEQSQIKEIKIDDQTQNELEQKKSSYLATLMEDLSKSDIGVENFPLYDEYLEPTLTDPDEVYERVDEDGDHISTYIKSYALEKKSFFYIVVCLKKSQEQKNEDILLPIISFPSIDPELYKKYKTGDKVSGVIKN